MPKKTVTPQDMERWARVLQAAREAGALPEEAHRRLHAAFIATDYAGQRWSIGLRTGQWSRLDQGAWAAAAPPDRLHLEESVIAELEALERPAPAAPAASPPSRSSPRPSTSSPAALPDRSSTHTASEAFAMNPEMEVLAQRVEMLERQARGWKLLVAVAILLAAAAIGMPFLAPRGAAPTTGGTARFSAVEANRIVLRDHDGQVAGGLEVTRDNTIRLVLGGRYGTRGAAFLEAHGNGVVGLTLRGPDGTVRATVLGAAAPSLSLSPDGGRSSVALMTTPDGAGRIHLTDASGRLRFRAP